MNFSIKQQFYVVTCLLILVSLLFYYYPVIDFNTAHLFFHHGTFVSGDFFKFSTKLVGYLSAITALASFIIAVYAYVSGKKVLLVSMLFLMLCFALGPGLLVNGILKAYWGRPRPHAVFSALQHLAYTKVWVMSHECHSNCSFVAGDSSCAFTFLAFAFLPWARCWKIVSAVCAILYFFYNGVLRIIHGAHFLSDVMIGALLIYLVILGCYQFCFSFLMPKISLKKRS